MVSKKYLFSLPLKFNRKTLLVGVAIFICIYSFGQVLPVGAQQFLFNSTELQEIVIETDYKQLIKEKNKENYQPASLLVTISELKTVTYPIQIRTRGNMRKKICQYPPLKLKFDKERLLQEGLDTTFNSLKLVVGCKKGKAYDVFVLKEYLAYQLYAALTDYSLRTQLVKLQIKSPQLKAPSQTTYAFFIENQDALAARFSGRCVRPTRVRNRFLCEDQLALLTLFQYMIGNTDWSYANGHNIRFIRSLNEERLIPVAYDFDYAGLVNAPYAVHHESIGMTDVQIRYFMGRLKNQAAFEGVKSIFLENKATLYQIINDFKIMKEKDRKSVKAYLNEFYKILENPKLFKKRILENCLD